MSRANAIAARVATTDDEHVLAFRCDAFLLRILMSRKYPVLLTEQFKGEMDALQIATWHVEVTGSGCACGNDYCIVLAGKCCIAMHFLTISELNALLLQKSETAIDDDLAQLEVRNTIAKQSSGSQPRSFR